MDLLQNESLRNLLSDFEDRFNLLEAKLDNDQTLLIKTEDSEDGSIDIWELTLSRRGYAVTPDKGNFDTVDAVTEERMSQFYS